MSDAWWPNPGTYGEQKPGLKVRGLVLERKSQNTGIKKDNRDYRGIAHLLKEYINPNKIRINKHFFISMNPILVYLFVLMLCSYQPSKNYHR